MTVNWKGDMAFEAVAPTGLSFVMDASPESGGHGLGPTPVEALVATAAACSAMDVISILEKKRQRVEAYRIEVDSERAPEGEMPRPVTKIVVRHIVSGPEVDPIAVARAVELSDTKYCTVISTLRTGPKVVSEWAVE